MTVLDVEDFDYEHAEARAAQASELEDDVARAQRLARLLDAQFDVFGIRFGLDAVVGLAPVVGDTIGFLAGLYPIHVVRKHRLGRELERRMIINLLIDYVAGTVPVLGDVFDVAFKANVKNARLLKHAATHQRKRKPVVSRAVA